MPTATLRCTGGLADNEATLKIDANPPVPCLGNTTGECFKQANVTSFPQSVAGLGPHTITIDVLNRGDFTGLLAHIVGP